MDKVQQMIAAGVSVATAIKEALSQNELTITAFARKYSLPLSSTIEAINGTRGATDGMVAALVAELGGTVDGWRRLLPRRITSVA